MRIETVDLGFLGAERVIASYLLLGEGSAAIVETGPTTCLENLMAGLEGHGVSPGDVRQVFLTHVHLDHAGAAGHLADRLPNATFYVHEVGLPHLADPEKLVKSATRIYGERMEELWGEVRPVPEDRTKALSGGEELEVADGVLSAHDTPGHAYHHLSYLEPVSGDLMTGDVAGIRMPGQSFVRPPTVPPEFDLEAWTRSIEAVRQMGPASLMPTHFGRFEDVERHLGELEQRLEDWLLFVEGRTDAGAGRDGIVEEFRAKGDAEMLAEGAGREDLDLYEKAGSYEMLADGLIRYVSKQREKG